MNNDFVSDAVYGGIDGTITTFAIMAAAIGSELSPYTVVVLAIASLVSDGFSMGVSSYESVVDPNENAMQKGITTFLAFVVIGLLPVLIYYYYSDLEKPIPFGVLIIASLLTLLCIGSLKHSLTNPAANKYQTIQSGLKTMTLGGIAGALSYYVAINLQR